MLERHYIVVGRPCKALQKDGQTKPALVEFALDASARMSPVADAFNEIASKY